MNVLPAINLLRAVSSTVLRKLLIKIGILTVVVLATLYGVMVLLAVTVSLWWLLFLAVLIPITLIAVVLAVILFTAVDKLSPRKLTQYESKKLVSFSDRLISVANNARVPYPVLVFLVAKDVIRGRESKFLQETIGESKALRDEFAELQKSFS